jgi:segregation and condensation protein A
MTYKVKLDVFEGPFDLLVYLIENARMSIYDIKVSEITEQYTLYIEKAKMLDVALASEFLVLAASLIEIKSKMLLPRVRVDDEGNMEFEDPRSELVARLLEYKRFKNAAEVLEKSEGQAMLVYAKPKEDISEYTGEPDVYLNLDFKQFVTAFKQFLHKKKKLEEIERNSARDSEPKVTAEEKVGFIRSLFSLKNKKTLSFKELLQSENDKYEVVVTFISVLEMARQRIIKLRQAVPFGEIKITEGEKADGE